MITEVQVDDGVWISKGVWTSKALGNFLTRLWPDGMANNTIMPEKAKALAGAERGSEREI